MNTTPLLIVAVVALFLPERLMRKVRWRGRWISKPLIRGLGLFAARVLRTVLLVTAVVTYFYCLFAGRSPFTFLPWLVPAAAWGLWEIDDLLSDDNDRDPHRWAQRVKLPRRTAPRPIDVPEGT